MRAPAGRLVALPAGKPIRALDTATDMRLRAAVAATLTAEVEAFEEQGGR